MSTATIIIIILFTFWIVAMIITKHMHIKVSAWWLILFITLSLIAVFIF